MPRKTFPGWYTPAETQHRLGLTRDALYAYEKSGRLHREYPPGRKQGVYSKEEVNALKREMEHFLTLGESMPPAAIGRATIEEMDETAKLINAIFDHYPHVERWKQYMARNPDLGLILKVEEQIVGCAFIFPLPVEDIQTILSQETTPPVEPDRIQPYVPGIPMHLYIRSVGILPKVSRIQKRIWGARLLSSLQKAFVSLGQRGIIVSTIWSRSNTKDGIRLLRHLGFTEIASQTTSRNFFIDVEQSGLPTIQEYKEALAKFRQDHNQGV